MSNRTWYTLAWGVVIGVLVLIDLGMRIPACRSPFIGTRDRAVARDLEGDLAGAAADYSAYLTTHPEDVATREARGLVYLRLGQPGPAIADLSAVLRSTPGDFTATVSRAEAYLRQGDNAAAIADYSQAMAGLAHPLGDGLLYPRGLAYLHAGRYELARADFAGFLARNEGNPYAAAGLQCAIDGSNQGACAKLPADANPAASRLIDAAAQAYSGC